MRLVDADAFKKILSEKEMQHDKRRSFDEYSYGAAGAYEYAGDLLDDMPTIELPQWTPCSKKLPDKIGDYIVSDIYGQVFSSTFDYINKRKDFGCFGYDDEYGFFVEDDTVVAWMPLPEPYKKKGE